MCVCVSVCLSVCLCGTRPTASQPPCARVWGVRRCVTGLTSREASASPLLHDAILSGQHPGNRQVRDPRHLEVEKKPSAPPRQGTHREGDGIEMAASLAVVPCVVAHTSGL